MPASTYPPALPSGQVRTPHLAWPPRLAKDGTVGVFDQDSPLEQAQAAALTLAVPVGAVIDNPKFGTPDQTFKQQIDPEQLHAALRLWEPRLTTDIAAQAVADRVAIADVTVRQVTNG